MKKTILAFAVSLLLAVPAFAADPEKPCIKEEQLKTLVFSNPRVHVLAELNEDQTKQASELLQIALAHPENPPIKLVIFTRGDDVSLWNEFDKNGCLMGNFILQKSLTDQVLQKVIGETS